MVVLTKRLAAVAKMAGGAESLIDVGTDHGLLPAYFAESGGAKRVAASDIREGPLAAAKRTAEECGVSDKIEFYLTDGLRGVSGFDTVVIAGMGGETAMGILSEARWTRDARVILQPQSKLWELAEWLKENGYGPLGASLVMDRKLYCVLAVTGGETKGEAMEEFLLKPLSDSGDPLFSKFAGGLARRERLIIEGLSRSGAGEDAAVLPRGRLKILEKYTGGQDGLR